MEQEETTNAVVPASGLSTRRRAETIVRLCGAAACLAAVAAAAVYVGGQGGTAMAKRDVMLSGKLSDNYYVDARVAQHREERMQELNELRRETQEKRVRKAALMSQEARQAQDEDEMANKQLERYNDIYTASTPEEAAMQSELPASDTVAATAATEMDQYDSPALTVATAYGKAGLTAYDGGVAPATVPLRRTQNLAAARVRIHAQSVKGLVFAASSDIEQIEAKLDSSAVMQEQHGSTQLKDILESSMLEIKGLAKRVGARLSGAPPRSAEHAVAPQAAPAQVVRVAAPIQQTVAVVTAPSAATPAVVQQQAQVADDKRINGGKPYPSMESMVDKYKAWMEAKKDMEEDGRNPDAAVGRLKSPTVQGLSSVPRGKIALAAAAGPCARINQANKGDIAARENACANTDACRFDFGYQLCLQKN